MHANTLEFTVLIADGSFLAGLLGALTGLGGGVVIVPLLALVFGVDIRYAIGASLVSVIATSSGAVKVLAMDRAMHIPFKVSTTTSNFMIGVTAAASAAIYLHRGYLDPGIAMPVMLGVLAGALLGARILPGAKVHTLRFVFNAAISLVAIEMIVQGIRGHI
ncbi:MAG: sulfite exporter TauE/SafE family protein [Candidatus Acidiferrales bacterium]